MLLVAILRSCRSQFTHGTDAPVDILGNVATLLFEYESNGRRDILENAVQRLRTCTTLRSQMSLYHDAVLCDALCELFDMWGGQEVIEEAVQVADRLSKSEFRANVPEHFILYCRARAYVLRYEATTKAADIDLVLDSFECRECLEDIECPELLMVWSRAVYWSYNFKRDVALLQRAMEYQEAALGLMPCDSWTRPLCTMYLADSYRTRYSRLLNPADCSKVEELSRDALDIADRADLRRARYFLVLGMATNMEYQHGNKPEYLEVSLSWCRSALDCATEGDRMLPLMLTVYAAGLRELYSFKGQIAALDDSVDTFQKAMALTSDQTAAYLPLLYNLCMTLMERFEYMGRLVDADLAISFLRQYLDQELPDGEDPTEQQSYICIILSSSLLSRYRLMHRVSDLHYALKICLAALKATPDHTIHLRNASQIHYWVYLETQKEEDLDRAMEYFLALHRPDRLERIGDLAAHYMYYGMMSMMCARHRHMHSYLESALTLLRTALTYTPHGHRERTEVLLALSEALMDYYRSRKDVTCLKEAVSNLNQALKEEPPSIQQAKCAVALAEATFALFEEDGDVGSLETALRLLHQAANDANGLIRDRFDSALHLARLAQSYHRHDIAFESYSLAVDLLPRLAWLGSERDARLWELRNRAPSLAADAAAAAIQIGRLERAVELLETGRGVFWSQILQLRSDLDDLRGAAPEMAAELEEVGRGLDMGPSISDEESIERTLQRQRRLAERWDKCVGEIRKLKGFEEFLKPPVFSQLVTAAMNGPVIIFNASAARCDALIVTLDHGSEHHAFPPGTFELIAQRATLLNRSLTVPRDSRGSSFLNNVMEVILDELWAAILQPVLWRLHVMYPAGLPNRVWLCPTGPFCLLPLHAARPLDRKLPGLIDLVTCSYTATFSSLIRARSHKKLNTESTLKILAVSQPKTPNHPELPFSINELEELTLASQDAQTTFLVGETATTQQVLNAMGEHAWVHMSCHGSLNARDPFKSCFRLHDGPLTLSRISELKLPHADFGFLSACHTARGLGALPDESLHLAAGLQLAGFKSVIATMWGIADQDAPSVAAHVYAHMLKDDKRDFTRSAKGLNNAIKALRRDGAGAARWVPFIHIGV